MSMPRLPSPSAPLIAAVLARGLIAALALPTFLGLAVASLTVVVADATGRRAPAAGRR